MSWSQIRIMVWNDFKSKPYGGRGCISMSPIGNIQKTGPRRRGISKDLSKQSYPDRVASKSLHKPGLLLVTRSRKTLPWLKHIKDYLSNRPSASSPFLPRRPILSCLSPHSQLHHGCCIPKSLPVGKKGEGASITKEKRPTYIHSCTHAHTAHTHTHAHMCTCTTFPRRKSIPWGFCYISLATAVCTVLQAGGKQVILPFSTFEIEKDKEKLVINSLWVDNSQCLAQPPREKYRAEQTRRRTQGKELGGKVQVCITADRFPPSPPLPMSLPTPLAILLCRCSHTYSLFPVF